MNYITNDSQFNDEKRIQITNEIPPYDMSEGVHRLLKNDFWKWLLGFSYVTYDLDKKNVYYNDFGEVDESIIPKKIVNGVESEVYGDPVTEKWDPVSNSYKKSYPKKQIRMELNGVLITENDLFLHEIYRYLQDLYPDHPDYTILLTESEIKEAFWNAASMIDFKLDFNFLSKVIDNIDFLDTDEAEREKFKLWYKSLITYAKNRKYFGSKAGMKMFAKQGLMETEVYSTGQYLPIVPEKTDSDKEISEYDIDHLDKNYKKLTRLIDWDNDIRKSYYEFKNFSNKKEFTGMSPINMENITVEIPSEIDSNGNRVVINSNDISDIIDEANKYDIFKDTKSDNSGLVYTLEANSPINKFSRDGIILVNDDRDNIYNIESLKTSIEDSVNSLLLTANQSPRFKTLYNFGNVFDGDLYCWEKKTSQLDPQEDTIYCDTDLNIFLPNLNNENNLFEAGSTYNHTQIINSSKVKFYRKSIINDEVVFTEINAFSSEQIVYLDKKEIDNSSSDNNIIYTTMLTFGSGNNEKVYVRNGMNDSCNNPGRKNLLKLVCSGSNLSSLILKEPDYQKGYIGDDVISKEEVANRSPLLKFLTTKYQEKDKTYYDIFSNAINNMFMNIQLYQFLDRAPSDTVVTPLNVTYNPMIKNTLVLGNKDTLKLYDDNPKYNFSVRAINIEDTDNGVAYYNIASYENKDSDPRINENTYIMKPRDLLGFNIDKISDNGYYEVVKTSPGYIKLSSSSYDLEENVEEIYNSYFGEDGFANKNQNLTAFEYYGFGSNGTSTSNKNIFGIVLNNKNNDKVYLEGNLILKNISTVTYNGSSIQVPRDIEFRILAIPEKMPEDVMLDVYNLEKFEFTDNNENVTENERKIYYDEVEKTYKIYIRNPNLSNNDNNRFSWIDANKLVLEEHLMGTPFIGTRCYNYNSIYNDTFAINRFSYLGSSEIDSNDYSIIYFTYLKYYDNIPEQSVTLNDKIIEYINNFENKTKFYDTSTKDYERSLIEYNSQVVKTYIIVPSVREIDFEYARPSLETEDGRFPDTYQLNGISNIKREQVDFLAFGSKIKSIVLAATSVVPVLDNNSFNTLLNLCAPNNPNQVNYNFLKDLIKFAKMHIASDNGTHYGYRYIPYLNPNFIDTLRNQEIDYESLYQTLEKQNYALSVLGQSMMNFLVFDDYNSCYYFNNQKVRVPIEVIISQNNEGKNTVLDFKSEDAKRKFELLNTGDQVLGKGSNNLTYITDIGNYSVEISTPLKETGEAVLYFYTDYDYSDDESQIDLNYEDLEIERETFELKNPETLGLYGSDDFPYVSNVIFPSSNIRDFQVSNTIMDNDDTFAKIMNAIYGSKKDALENSNNGTEYNLIPSVLKDSKTLFFEVNLNKIFKYPNKAGSTNNLMCVDWLDFLTDNKDIYGTHSDNINVGTNLTLQTDRSGYYTLRSGAQYTDDEIKTKFQTFGWTDDTIPMYVQLGSGGATNTKYMKSIDEITQPTVYGAAFYDDEISNLNKKVSELRDNGGDIKKRFTYFGSENAARVKETSSGNTSSNVSIDNFILESPIGEYDIQLHKKIGDHYMTTINVSFYKQEYNDIEENNIQLVSLPNQNKYEFVDSTDDSSDYVFKGFSTSLDEAKNLNLGNDEYVTIIDEAGDALLDGDHFIRINLGEESGGAKTYQMKFGTVYYDNVSMPFIINAESGETSSLIYQNLCKYEGNTSDSIIKRNFEILFNSVNRCFWKYSYSSASFNNLNFEEDINQKISNTCFICKIMGDKSKKLEFPECENNDEVPSYYIAFFAIDKGTQGWEFKSFKILPSYFTSTLSFDDENASDRMYKLFILPCTDEVKMKSGSTGNATISVPDLFDNYNYYNIFTYLDNYGSNKVKLQRGGILDGSQDISFNVNLNYKAEGYIIENNNKINVIYDVAKNPIFYDKDLEEFYTYSTYQRIVDGTQEVNSTLESGKIFIKFKEQKFFKDVKFLIGKFKYKNEFKSRETASEDTSILNKIEGIEFDTDNIAKTDRILEIKEALVRTPYDENNESKFFSNSFFVDYAIKGIDLSGENPVYVAGPSESSTDIPYDTKKYMFKNEIAKLQEYEDGVPKSEYLDTRVFGNISTQEENDTTENDNDAYCKISGGELTSTIGRFEDKDLFKYHKNLMVFKGELNATDCKTITGTSKEYDKVLSNISIGDEIIAAIPYSKNATITSEFKTVNLKNVDNSTEFKHLANFENFLIGIDENNSLWYCKSDPLDDDKDVLELSFKKMDFDLIPSDAKISDFTISNNFTDKKYYLIVNYTSENNSYFYKYEILASVSDENETLLDIEKVCENENNEVVYYRFGKVYDENGSEIDCSDISYINKTLSFTESGNIKTYTAKVEFPYYSTENNLNNYDAENIRVLDENGITTTLLRKGDLYVNGYLSNNGLTYENGSALYNESQEKVVNLIEKDLVYEKPGFIDDDIEPRSPFKKSNGLSKFNGLSMTDTNITVGLYNSIIESDSLEGDDNDFAKIDWFHAIAFCNELTNKISGDYSNCVYFSDSDMLHPYKKEDAENSIIPYYKSLNTGFRLPESRELDYALRIGSQPNNGSYEIEYESEIISQDVFNKFNGSGPIKFASNPEWCYDGYLDNGFRYDYDTDYNSISYMTGSFRFVLNLKDYGLGSLFYNMFEGQQVNNTIGTFRVCFSNVSPTAVSEACVEEPINSDKLIAFDNYDGVHSFIYSGKDTYFDKDRYYLETQNKISVLAENLKYNGKLSEDNFWVKVEIPSKVYSGVDDNFNDYSYFTLNENPYIKKRYIQIMLGNGIDTTSDNTVLLVEEDGIKEGPVRYEAGALVEYGPFERKDSYTDMSEINAILVTTDAYFRTDEEAEKYLKSKYIKFLNEKNETNANDFLGDYEPIDVYKNSTFTIIPIENNGSYKVIGISNNDLSKKSSIINNSLGIYDFLDNNYNTLEYDNGTRKVSPFKFYRNSDNNLVSFIDDDMFLIGGELINEYEFWNSMTYSGDAPWDGFFNYCKNNNIISSDSNDDNVKLEEFKNNFVNYYDLHYENYILSSNTSSDSRLEEMRNCLSIIGIEHRPIIFCSTNGKSFVAIDISRILNDVSETTFYGGYYSGVEGISVPEYTTYQHMKVIGINKNINEVQVELQKSTENIVDDVIITEIDSTSVVSIPISYSYLYGFEFDADGIKYNNDLSSLPKEGTNVVNSYGEETGIICPSFGTQVLIFYPTLKINVLQGTSVASISLEQGIIKLSSKLKLSMEAASSISIILAVKTYNDITNQLEYICSNPSEDLKKVLNYFSEAKGIYYPRIPFTTEVETYNDANFIYSPNEITDRVEDESDNEYPSTVADIYKRYYKYESDYDNNGQLTGSHPVYLKNDFGSNIYYCNLEEEDYGLKKFQGVLSSFKKEKLIGNSVIPATSFGCTVFNYIVFNDNNSLLKQAQYPVSFTSSFRFNTGLRYLVGQEGTDGTVLSYSREDGNEFAPYPNIRLTIEGFGITDNEESEEKEILKNDVLLKISNNSYETFTTNTQITGKDTFYEKIQEATLYSNEFIPAFKYLNYIIEVEGEENLSRRNFEFVEFEGDYYLADVTGDSTIFVPKRRLKISGYILTNYQLSEEEVPFFREFITNENNNRTYLNDEFRPISKIYISPKGYGSVLGDSYLNEETNIVSKLPWEIDREVFKDEFLYNSLDKKIALCDKTGKVLKDANNNLIYMKVPLYASLLDINSNCERIIDTSNYPNYVPLSESVISTDKGTSVLNIKTIEDESIDFIKFPECFKEKDEDGEYKEHYVRIKILTNSNIEAPLKFRNNPDYYAEINVNDIKLFPPNRVYFDPQGLPEPPIDNIRVKEMNANNKPQDTYISFRNKNKEFFYNYKYTNRNEKNIYECNEEGKYVAYRVIKPEYETNSQVIKGYIDVTDASNPIKIDENDSIINTETSDTFTTALGNMYQLKKQVVGEENGDCSYDLRLFQPYQPIYNSCEEWYYDDFFVEGNEKNPFTQTLKLDSYYDTNSKSLKESFKSYSYKKSGITMVLVENEEKEKVFDIVNLSSYEDDAITDSVINDKNSKMLDCKNGEVKFALFINENYLQNVIDKTGEDKVYRDIKYGISYSSDHYLEKITSETEKPKYIADGNFTFIVNSTEDLIDKTNKDKAISQISELAILDKNKKIIAYAVFPPIEYRTDTQHISFTCLINDEFLQ